MPIAYMRVIKDMYDGVRIRVRTLVGDTDDFFINMRHHQGSALSTLLFNIIMDKFTREFKIRCLSVCYLLTI